jgi:ATP-dependent Lhr-like helicase
MDVEGFLEVLRGLHDGTIERRAVDTAEPSAFARGILSSQPYTFLDDAPLEERRTQAVLSRRVLDPRTADEIGILDAEAIARVRGEAWPQPESAEEVHEALLWMGYVTTEESSAWAPWLAELESARRVVRDGDRWFAVEAPREPLAVLRGRMEALGPVFSDDPLLAELEATGVVLRTRIDGREAWCDRRLLARIHRYTVERLRREIEPVSAAQLLRFLACWQHADPEHRLEGPRGVAAVLTQLAGFEAPAASWEGSILPARIRGYKREWLDQLVASGEIAWGRFWGEGASAIRRTPICFAPREDLDAWMALAAKNPPGEEPSGVALEVRDALARRGAMFVQEIARELRQPPAFVEEGLKDLIARGRVTCDSYGGLRWFLVPTWRRKAGGLASGRWSLLSRRPGEVSAEFVARRMLARTGVVFRKTLARERVPVVWRDVARVLRTLESRGEVRGGRFVAGFDGEQYALPEAVTLLRAVRRRSSSEADPPPVSVSAADPLNFRGILTPDERVPPTAREAVRVA